MLVGTLIHTRHKIENKIRVKPALGKMLKKEMLVLG